MKVPLPRRFLLLPRRRSADKSRYGHVLILAGSRGLTGAAILASRAALKSGSGLVTLGTPASLENRMAKLLVEVMQLGLPETKEATLSVRSYEKIRNFIQKRGVNVLALGPGLSVHPETTVLVRRLVQNAAVPTVLDADGLNSFRSKKGFLCRHASALVLTPHRREFERLFGEKLPDNQVGRARLAKKISKFYDVVLVLKGHRTLVVKGDLVYENRTGNPGLAKGGAGDVLTGMIAAFTAQGLKVFEAAVWAVYFHGRAADLAVRQKGELGLTASDVIDFLPRAFKTKT